MNQQLVKTLMVEIDGNMEKLRRALGEGTAGLKEFEQKSTRAGAVSGAASDAVASKQANAARGIAMATETIARQGAVSADAAKQVISQASNMAFALGPTGAVVGAVGISTLAIVSMFTRARREMQETIDQARDAADAFDEMDAVGQARTLNRVVTGRRSDDAVLSTDQIMKRPEEERDKLFRERGIARLREDLARLQAAVPELKDWERMSAGVAGDFGITSGTSREIKAVTDALAELTDEYDRNSAEFKENAAATAQRDLDGMKRAAATQATAEALREQTRLEKEGERNRETARRQALEAMGADETRRLQQFYTALTQGFEGTRADIEQSFAELVSYAETKGGQAQIPVLTAARDQALELVDLLQRNKELLSGLAEDDFLERTRLTGQRTRGGPDEANLVAIERQRDASLAIANDAARSDTARAAAMRQAIALQTELERRIEASGKARERETDAVIAQAQAIGQAIDGVLQLAGAWGGVRREVLDTLRALVQIGANVPSLLNSLADFKQARGGKLTDDKGNLVSIGAAAVGVSTAALPVIGALASIAGAIFGSNPAERERKRIQHENTKAIERLSEEMGSLGIALSGAQLDEARVSVNAMLGGRMNTERGEFAVSELGDRWRILWKHLRAEGVDRRAMEQAAERLGVTLDGTLGSFRRLQEAIDEFAGKIGEFGDSYSEQRTIGNALVDAKQITDPIERALERAKPAQDLSPIVQQLLGNADLSTAEGRAALRQQVIAIFETMQAGGDELTAAQLGRLTRDELFAFLNELLGDLDAIESNVPGTGSSVGGISGFRGLTEAAGERMADYLRGLYATATIAEGQRARMIEHLAALNVLAQTPLAVPMLPSAASAMAAVRVGGGALNIESIRVELGGIVLHLDRTESADGASIARATLDSFSVQVEQVMFDAIRRAQKATGDLSVSPMRLR